MSDNSLKAVWLICATAIIVSFFSCVANTGFSVKFADPAQEELEKK